MKRVEAVVPQVVETVEAASNNGGRPADPDWPDPMGDAAFHGAAGEFVATVSPHSEADPAALLAQYLTAAGSLFGTSRFYQVEGDKHPARLWVAVVGSTSKARKGTSWSRVRQIASDVDGGWAERISGGLSSGEGPVWAVRDPIYRQVKKTTDTGDTEFVEVLDDPGVEDKRLLVVESELSRVFDVIGRSGSTLSETLRRLWDGGIISNLTKNSAFKSTNPHVSVVGHISKEELRRKLSDGEVFNGLANRFMLVAARRAQMLPFGGEVEQEDLNLLRQQLAGAVSAAHDKPGRISWDTPTTKLWGNAYRELSSDRPGMVGAVTARAEAHVVRLAVTYALLDSSPLIRQPHLEAALAFWDYSARSAQWAFGDSTGDPNADAILVALRGRRETGMTRTDLRDLFARNLPVEKLTRSLTVLVINDLAYMEIEQTGGRKAERWRAR